MCPTDAVESRGSKRDLYLQRPIKIISYDWNGQVGGYIAGMTGRKTPLPSGKTFKIAALRPTGILQWEKDELIPLFISMMPAIIRGRGFLSGMEGLASKAQVDVKGGASVGLLDGSASRITYQAYYQMSGPPAGGLPPGSTIQRSVPAPNDLYYDPRDRWEGRSSTRRGWSVNSQNSGGCFR